jgi:hypothetical protein
MHQSSSPRLRLLPKTNFNWNRNDVNMKQSVLLFCIIQRVVLYGCETWSRTSREEHWFRVFDTGCLREYLDLIEMTLQDGGENCIMRSIMIYVLHQILLVWLNQWERDGGACSAHGRAYKIFVGKSGKATTRKPRRGWEDCIKWIFGK